MAKPFYITTTLPYVNSDPHIGFAMEIIRADTIARYKRLLGYDVFFNTGTDEHGAKIYEVAVKENIPVQEYVDRYAEKFNTLAKELNIEDVHFIRTTDEKHIRAAQEMWKRCNEHGYIYKKTYKTKYCVGCELEKTDSELVDGKCPIHPNREIEYFDEENYFFRFSEFQKSLLELYAKESQFVIPDFRFNEIKNFVEKGLEDFSISRLKEKMPWGVPVPGDEAHVMYVWFDALTSYISTLDWPLAGNFATYWEQDGKREVVQYCGKDNLRQQSAMWQAMLMASGLPLSSAIVINGFITGADGQKMSKSLGNVISPFDILSVFKEVTEFPEDVLRFVVLHDIASFEDSGVSLDTIKASYQAHLANGLGNLTSRIMKMVTLYTDDMAHLPFTFDTSYGGDISHELEHFNIKKAFETVMNDVTILDEKIQREEAFKVIKEDRVKGLALINGQRILLQTIGRQLQPFLPRTSAKILECIRENKMPERPLFERLP